ncbi:unnamed protein product [Prorocentrum cordatum]|uniref:Uncharacterized protein n=1 Tax=Prorocentrum cordatum TaxID=2364126 RepID=A0ABN9WC09_9DINO|nr:unnamed protein product [Polarella glacialis]
MAYEMPPALAPRLAPRPEAAALCRLGYAARRRRPILGADVATLALRLRAALRPAAGAAPQRPVNDQFMQILYLTLFSGRPGSHVMAMLFGQDKPTMEMQLQPLLAAAIRVPRPLTLHVPAHTPDEQDAAGRCQEEPPQVLPRSSWAQGTLPARRPQRRCSTAPTRHLARRARGGWQVASYSQPRQRSVRRWAGRRALTPRRRSPSNGLNDDGSAGAGATDDSSEIGESELQEQAKVPDDLDEDGVDAASLLQPDQEQAPCSSPRAAGGEGPGLLQPVGAQVHLTGLREATAFNGMSAVILTVVPAKAMYQVRMDDGSIRTVRAVNVRSGPGSAQGGDEAADVCHTIDEVDISSGARGGEAKDGLLPSEPAASSTTVSQAVCGALDDEAMSSPASAPAHVVQGRVSMCIAEADLLDAAVPPVRCADSVIEARLAHRPPPCSGISHDFLMCRIYSRSAHGRSGWR